MPHTETQLHTATGLEQTKPTLTKRRGLLGEISNQNASGTHRPEQKLLWSLLWGQLGGPVISSAFRGPLSRLFCDCRKPDVSSKHPGFKTCRLSATRWSQTNLAANCYCPILGSLPGNDTFYMKYQGAQSVACKCRVLECFICRHIHFNIPQTLIWSAKAIPEVTKSKNS